MRMEDRRPRASRFGTESREARLAHLREKAPTLGSSRRMRFYAIFGSILLVLTVSAFYLVLQIYRGALEQREESALMTVESAPVVDRTETQKALERIEEESASEAAAEARVLEELKSRDLLEELESPPPDQGR